MLRVTYIALLTVCLSIRFAPVHAQIPQDTRDDIIAKHYTATLMVVTALTGADTSTLAAANLLEMNHLSDESRSQLIEAAQTVLSPTLYAENFANLPSNAALGLVIETRFTIALSGEAFGGADCTLPISDLLPAISGRSINSDAVGSLPALADPPSFAAVSSEAPASPDARIPWIKSRTLELLERIAGVRLSRASVPFSSRDFTSGMTIAIRSLSPTQARWLSTLYSKHRERVNLLVEAAELYCKDPTRSTRATVRPTSVTVCRSIAGEQVCARLADIPEAPLPDWSALEGRDVSLKLHVEYRVGMTVPGTEGGQRKIGWVVN